MIEELLDDARERPRAEVRVVALLREPAPRLRRELDLDALLTKLGRHLGHELVDHEIHHLGAEPREAHHLVEAIAELRAEEPLDGALGPADRRLGPRRLGRLVRSPEADGRGARRV